MNFSDLVIALRLNISQFTDAMRTVRQQAQRLSSVMAQASTAGSADALIQGYTTLNDRLHRVGLGLRDIARISSGIVVSQTFYGITRSVNDATNALWEFNESLDYARVSYSALFNDSDLAGDFLTTLQQFSVDTIFEYSDLEKMSRKLLAYGIEYKNLMYIVEGLTNIGTMSGDSAALERLAVAIGQINAKGVLQAEEVRQLVNAYAPMHDILRDRFGLTDEDFENLGDLRLPADKVINAIVEYANQEFGAVSDAAMLTITGLNNRIVDSLKVMGADMIAPFTTFYKSLAKYIAEQLSSIYDIYKTSGLGGVFEYLVPSEEWQARLRQLVANLKNFIATVTAHFATMWPVISQVFGGILDAANMLLAVMNAVASGVTAAMQSISGNTPVLNILTRALIVAASAWVLFRLQALASAAVAGVRAIILGVAQAVLFLSRAIMTSPILSLFVLLGAVMIGVAANASSAENAITKLLNTLNSYSAGGNTADDVLQVTDVVDEGTTNSEQFWESMKDGADSAADAADGAGDAANKAAKAAKGLLSFDEVFKLPEKSSSGAGAGAGDLAGGLDGIGDLADVLGGLGSALIPEIPDLSSYASDFISSLYNDLWAAMKSIASGGATGALIGGLVGFAIGGLVTKTMAGAFTGAKWGAKIGAIAGAGFAAFWTDTYNEMEASLTKIAVSGAIGTLIGGLTGMVIGAFATRTLDGALLGAKLGAAIGTFIGAGVGGFWAMATEEMSHAIEGIAVGSATGMLIGALTGLLIGAFSTRTLAGALTGAKYGATIGTLAGGALVGIMSTFEDSLKERIAAIAWGGAEGMLISGLTGMLLGAFVTKSLKGALTGAKLGSSLGGLLGAGLEGFFGDAEESITANLEGLFSSVSAASYGALIGGLVGMIAGAIIGAFAGGVGALPGAKAGATIGAGIGGWVAMLVTYLQNSGVIDAFAEWLGSIWATIANWFAGVGRDIAEWSGKFFGGIAQWFRDVWSHVETWFANLKLSFKNWWDKLTDIQTWKDGWESVKQWFANVWSSISNWFIGLKEDFVNWWNNLTIVQNWRAGWHTISEWFTKLFSDISHWFTTTKNNIKTWWNNLFDPKTWKSGWDSIKSWFSDLFKDIRDWFRSIGSSISNWWDGLWDDKEVSVSSSVGSRNGGRTGSFALAAHAKGGIFNREHIARFAEGDKAEAVIPLEDNVAMRPFVNAISDGILQGLLPSMSSGSNTGSLPPMYVGTLIADERGIKELYKKFELIEAKELARKGLA